MKKNNKTRVFTSLIFLAAALILLIVSRLSGSFTQWYSTHLYQVWVNIVGRFMNLFPFSVVEVLLYLLILVLVVTAVRLIIRLILKKAGAAQVGSWFSNLFLTAAILLFLYVLNCGINYNRISFSNSADIQAVEYTADELTEICRWLTVEVNDRADKMNRDEAGVMQLTGATSTEAVVVMEALGEDYPELAGYYPKPKGLIFPWILSIQQLSGVYSPFTIEANYNSSMIDYQVPFTACHELSHLRGFMQEEEANFIAFLACVNADDEQFQYSGFLSGWSYCMNVLYQVDYEAWEEVRAELAATVELDLTANREYWLQYDGRVAEAANQINDTYLKANGQESGVKSYSQMVDLIAAYYLDK